MTKTLY